MNQIPNSQIDNLEDTGAYVDFNADNFFEAEIPNLDEIDDLEHTNTFSRQEQINIAGVASSEEAVPLQVDEEFMIREDGGTAQSSEENPIIRTFFIAGIFGFFIILFYFMWQFISPREGELKLVDEGNKTEETISEEKPELDYIGKLALIEQEHQLEKGNNQVVLAPVDEPKTPEVEISEPEEVVVSEPVAQPPRPVVRSNPVATRPVARPRNNQTVERKVDPVDTWQNLANFGTGVNLQKSELFTSQNSLSQSVSSSDPLENRSEGALLVSNNFVEAENAIIRRRKTEPKVVRKIDYGTVVSARIATPMVWDESLDRSNQVSNIFSIVLDEDFLDSEGNLILEEGQTLLVEADRVNGQNRFVNASVIRVHPRDGDLEIPKGKLILMSHKQEPLIAEAFIDKSGSTARNDITIMALDSLAAVGNILTDPDTRTSTVVNGNFSSSSTTVDNSNVELYGAAFEGFEGLSNRVQRRTADAQKDLQDVPNISFLEVGTRISIVAVDTIQID